MVITYWGGVFIQRAKLLKNWVGISSIWLRAGLKKEKVMDIQENIFNKVIIYKML